MVENCSECPFCNKKAKHHIKKNNARCKFHHMGINTYTQPVCKDMKGFTNTPFPYAG
jgi:hypothetical protein